MRHSKYDVNNPFSLYVGYLDLVRPVQYNMLVEKWKKRCAELEAELR